MPDSARSDAAPSANPILTAALIDRLPFGVTVYHLDVEDDPGSLRLVHANEAASDAVGFDIKAEIGRTFRESLPQALETKLPTIYADVARGGEARDLGEIEYEDDRIQKGLFQVNVFPLPDRHVGVTFEEVTQRRTEEEARLLSLVDNLPELAWTAQPDGNIDFYNERWYEYTGTTPEEMEGWGWQKVHDPELLPSVVERWTHSIETGEPFEMEFPLRRADGVFRWFLTRVRPLRNDDGEIVRWFGTNADIHAKKEAESAIRQSESQLRNLFASIDEGFCLAEIVLDNDGKPVDYRFLEVNPLFEDMSGIADATGKTIRELVPDFEHHWIETYARVAAGGEPVRFESRSEALGRWFDVFAAPVEPDGRFALVFKDITERKRTEEALAESEARYRFMSETLEQQIWTALPSGQLDYVNQYTLDYFGRTFEEMIGQGWQGVVHEDDLPLVVERWTRSLETGEPYEVEFRLRCSEDGEWRWHIGRASAFREDDGRIVKWFGANTDIHEKKEIESVLAETNRELEARVGKRTEEIAGFSEDLKALHRITTTRHANPEGFFQDYLRAGCEIFELPIGILSETPLDETTGERTYRLHTVESPVPEIAAGLEVPLSEAFCDAVVERGKTVSYADASNVDELSCHPAYTDRGLRAFIGTPIYLDDELFGTLNFVSPEPRPEGFAAHEHELIEVMAELVGRLLSAHRAERQRIEADARYRSVVEGIEEGLVLADADGVILMSNPAAKEILGFTERTRVLGRVAGEPRWPVVDANGQPIPEEALPERAALRTGEPVTGVIQGILHPDGATRWVSVSARPARLDAEGSAAAVIVSFVDVTELRAAESKAKASEAQLQKAQQIANVGSWRWDIAQDEIVWSDELFRIFGVAPDSFEPTFEKYLTRVHEDDRDVLGATIERAVAERSTYEVDHRVIRPDGEVRHIHGIGEVVPGPDGEPVALQGTAQDVTAAFEAGRALERLSRELEQILEAAGEGIYGLALDGTTTFVNRAAADMLGWAPDALLGKRQHDVLHHHRADGSVYPVEECPIYQTIHDGMERRVNGEVFWRKDGSSFPVEYVTAPMRADGEPVGVVVVFQNVTERVRTEQNLRHYADQLEERNAELEQFAYVASHDLQEPLRMVSSFLQLLQRRYADQLDETADEYINYAVDGASRMKILIQDLLAYSRIGTRGKAFEPVDMTQAVETVLGDLALAIEETGATVEAEALPTTLADASQMRQVFQNLIGNAIKFHGDTPPEVRVSAMRTDTARTDGSQAPGWRFAVADNGIGIAAEHAERIFQIFQRLHTRDEYEGTGIGLAMCKKIIERHTGRIWLESKPGDGTTFYFTIPDQPSQEHAADASPSAAPQIQEPGAFSI